MPQKRILLLGGNYAQMTCTLAAKAEGYYVISVDYLPDNPAHKYADEYHNVSTIDKEAVLALARTLNIDGIVSYASDVSAPTAAYVAEALGLPTNPYKSVMIMTHKDLFRAFLREHGFPMPEGAAFSDYEKALAFFRRAKKPLMVKPIDSSGSKGVTKVDPPSCGKGSSLCDPSAEHAFRAAWEEALSYSRAKEVIVEQYITRTGFQIDGDGFMVDGKLKIFAICDQMHDESCSLTAPTGSSYPSTQEDRYREKARKMIERLLCLLGMHMGAYNIEYIVGDDGEIYILEIGPRNGGNYISDTIKAASGIDLPRATVRQAVGDEISDLEERPASCAAVSYLIHALSDGIYRGIEIDPELEKHIVLKQIYVKDGDRAERFRNASCDLGALVLTFDATEEMLDTMEHMNDLVHVLVDPADQSFENDPEGKK